MTNLISSIENFPYIGVFLLLLLGEVGFPFPEDTTLILSGFLIAQGVVRPIPMLLTIYGGLLITDFLLYYLGKKYGRTIVEHRRFRRLMSAEKLSKIEEKVKKWGVLVVFVGRHIIGIRSQVFLVMGVTRMPALRFLAADAISAIITIAIMVGIGYFGSQSLQKLTKDVKTIEHVIVIGTVLLILAGVLITYFRNRNDHRKL